MVPPAPSARRPLRDAVLFLASGISYLLLVGLFVVVSNAFQALGAGAVVPSSLFDARDLVALFGWVGLTICGVSTIVIPSHFGRPIRPRGLPRAHFVLANVGLVGFFSGSVLAPSTALAAAFLVLTGLSYVVFAVGLARTVFPFVLEGRSGVAGPPGGPRPGPEP
jgi:hypothetical protein